MPVMMSFLRFERYQCIIYEKDFVMCIHTSQMWHLCLTTYPNLYLKCTVVFNQWPLLFSLVLYKYQDLQIWTNKFRNTFIIETWK